MVVIKQILVQNVHKDMVIFGVMEIASGIMDNVFSIVGVSSLTMCNLRTTLANSAIIQNFPVALTLTSLKSQYVLII